jgi:ectoine hydroxylase-related dioxygenase (phytanoyl-CoA dioxygenase family)
MTGLLRKPSTDEKRRPSLTTVKPNRDYVVTASDYTAMTDSTDDLGDGARLREQMEEEGYLYFSRLVDSSRVLRAKRDIMRLLREHFILEGKDENEPIWNGGPEPTEAEWMAVYERIAELDSFQDVARSPEIISVIEGICGEPARVWEQQLIRVIYPTPESKTAGGTGAHQDGDPKLGYKASVFYTAWVALMDIEISVGGLAVAPRSHQAGILESAGTAASSAKVARDGAYGLDDGALWWATADYPAGGTVIFPCRMVHRGLPNHSDRVRLSGDFRYQPTSQSASWLSETRGPEIRRVAQAIDETLASRALYVTARPTPGVLDVVRQQMLEERNTTLERAQELVLKLKGHGQPVG